MSLLSQINAGGYSKSILNSRNVATQALDFNDLNSSTRALKSQGYNTKANSLLFKRINERGQEGQAANYGVPVPSFQYDDLKIGVKGSVAAGLANQILNSNVKELNNRMLQSSLALQNGDTFSSGFGKKPIIHGQTILYTREEYEQLVQHDRIKFPGNATSKWNYYDLIDPKSAQQVEILKKFPAPISQSTPQSQVMFGKGTKIFFYNPEFDAAMNALKINGWFSGIGSAIDSVSNDKLSGVLLALTPTLPPLLKPFAAIMATILVSFPDYNLELLKNNVSQFISNNAPASFTMENFLRLFPQGGVPSEVPPVPAESEEQIENKEIQKLIKQNRFYFNEEKLAVFEDELTKYQNKYNRYPPIELLKNWSKNYDNKAKEAKIQGELPEEAKEAKIQGELPEEKQGGGFKIRVAKQSKVKPVAYKKQTVKSFIAFLKKNKLI